jgi:hypothetical protein
MGLFEELCRRVCGWLTGNPHLTRRWPFGRVTEGLPTIQALHEIMESRSSDMRIAQGFRALGLSTVSGSTSRPLRPHLRSTISFTRPRRPFPNRVRFFW